MCQDPTPSVYYFDCLQVEFVKEFVVFDYLPPQQLFYRESRVSFTMNKTNQ